MYWSDANNKLLITRFSLLISVHSRNQYKNTLMEIDTDFPVTGFGINYTDVCHGPYKL